MDKPVLKQKQETSRLATEDELKHLKSVVEEIVKARKAGFSLHALMLASATIEENMLPHLIDMVLDHMKLSDKKNIISSDSFTVKNALYFALTQDIDLYSKLEQFRKIRNRVTHKIFTYQGMSKIGDEADKAHKCFVIIVQKIVDRLTGKVPVPVLTYYPKGWNDALKKAVEIIQKH